MRRVSVVLILAFLVLAASTAVFADGVEEVQPPETVAPEASRPEASRPEVSRPEVLPPGELPFGAARGRIRGRAPVSAPGEWGCCPLCGSTSRADQELAVWAKATGVAAEELKKHLSDGMGFGEICGAVVIARKQGKSFAEVIQKAKADKVNIRTLAYAVGITMDQFAEEVQALHTAFLEQAVADGLLTEEQAGMVRRGLGQGGVRQRMLQTPKALAGSKSGLGFGLGLQRGPMSGFGSARAGMPGFARAGGSILMRWRSMIRGRVGAPGPVK